MHILAKAGSSMRVSGRFAEHIANSFYDPLLLWGAHSFMTFEEPFYLYIVGEVSLTSRIKDVIILHLVYLPQAEIISSLSLPISFS